MSFQYNPLNGHKSAHGPHRRDLTHTLCKVTELFFIEILSFSQVTETIGFFPYKSLYLECYAAMSMFADAHLFRAWATCSLYQLKSNRCRVIFSVFTDYTTRRTNKIASEWGYKNQNSSCRGKFRLNFNKGEVTSSQRGVRVIRVIEVLLKLSVANVNKDNG